MDTTSDLKGMREKAISYYMASDFKCSETVLKVIHEHFASELPESIVAMASGFHNGLGGSGSHLRGAGGRDDGPGHVFRQKRGKR